MILRTFAAIVLVTLAPIAARAAPGCAVPSDLPLPHVEGASADQPARVEPIGGYTLALIWTPEHCVHAVPGAETFECGPGTGKGFALHGLWPDGVGKSRPQWCAATEILPRRTIAAHFCATPSPQLLQHEWAKHGTCIPGMTPDRYFGRSNRLFHAIHYPDMAALARKPLTAGDFAVAFAAVNPGMRADMLRLNLDRDGWLREVWLCLDVSLGRKRCAAPMRDDQPVRIKLPG